MEFFHSIHLIVLGNIYHLKISHIYSSLNLYIYLLYISLLDFGLLYFKYFINTNYIHMIHLADISIYRL